MVSSAFMLWCLPHQWGGRWSSPPQCPQLYRTNTRWILWAVCGVLTACKNWQTVSISPGLHTGVTLFPLGCLRSVLSTTAASVPWDMAMCSPSNGANRSHGLPSSPLLSWYSPQPFNASLLIMFVSKKMNSNLQLILSPYSNQLQKFQGRLQDFGFYLPNTIMWKCTNKLLQPAFLQPRCSEIPFLFPGFLQTCPLSGRQTDAGPAGPAV